MTAATNEAVYLEFGYLLAAAAAIVVGVLAGTWSLDNWSTGITFAPQDWINTFALFCIMAQVIERLRSRSRRS